MRPTQRGIRRFFAALIGLVFFSAGFAKLLDPVGAGLVVSEYFKFAGLGAHSSLALVLGVLLAMLEAACGIALVTGVFRKAAAIATSAFLAVFTVLTLVLWIANPEMDCGCFGEIIHLTHFQSFLKNVILCVFALIAFIPIKNLDGPRPHKYVSFGLVSALVLFLFLRCAYLLPFKDFTQFRLSARLAVSDLFDKGGDEIFEATFVYEKDGKESSFTLDDLPDSTWTFVRTETAPLNDNILADHPTLSFYDASGEYRDELAAEGRVMVISAYSPSSVSAGRWKKIAEYAMAAELNGFSVLILVSDSHESVISSLPSELAPQEKEAIESSLYFSDYRTVVALNRSNGGATYFSDGHLIQKWSVHNLPSDSRLEKIASSNDTDLMLTASTRGRLQMQASFLLAYALLLLV